ncbi:3-oxoacyl-ACP reductase [Bordetella tumbae]|uniref:SDR family NAD(P)-dependent oxidoreductase n=1 Tax=Bordetella tumbae TaxID=1649139 RepID=UPI0039EFAAB2
MKKTAIITGGASGIGQATAQTLHTRGWDIWCLDINIPKSASGALPDPLGITYLQCDVSDTASVQSALLKIAESTDKVDALICSAGVLRTGNLMDQTPGEIDLMMQVNIKAPWLIARETLPLLKRASRPDDPARVVFVGSISGIRPKVGAGFYGASKAALHVLTGVLAVELAASGILVNAVAPGTVDTPMITAASQPSKTSQYKPSGESPLGRIANPGDIVQVILFFLSNAAQYVTGTVLPVDGGTRAAFQPR